MREIKEELKGKNDNVFNAIPSKESVIESGKNCYLYDTLNNKYLDLGAGIWCSILGHSNSNLINSIKNQAEKLMHLGSGFYSKSPLNK